MSVGDGDVVALGGDLVDGGGEVSLDALPDRGFKFLPLKKFQPLW